MTKKPFNVGVHRFHDSVAIWIGTGETVYLTTKDARKLSRAINKTCRSIERERYLDSSDLTFSLEGEQADIYDSNDNKIGAVSVDWDYGDESND